ncbi:E3 ubiquitin-protein ligase rnf152 [Trichomycterus rosablanca]|uniref:E3 ubiquitin-protein ligase rnf152 n=1 Tax=Trichomycterus rosablanca TaxID=2290929 RepID=UPI002F350BF9
METAARFFGPECRICFDAFSLRRRPKLLGCGHTCCSVCLGQIVLDRREICCPWCRQVTHLGGLSVVQLPDDPEALAACSPVSVRLPDSGHYPLPLGTDGPADRRGFRTGEEATQTERIAGAQEEEEERETAMKSSAWTSFCAVLMVAVILIFLLAIVLHNMSCVSKRFSIISCG